MRCQHPYCPMGHGLTNWEEIIDLPELGAQRAQDKNELRNSLPAFTNDFGVMHPNPTTNTALLNRLLGLCPCLFSQIDVRATARTIVHLCEITLAERIESSNVERAFNIQDPNNHDVTFLYPALREGAGAGDIMEALCSEVLSNHCIPHMEIDNNGWPVWASQSHLSLNSGKMIDVKLYGDILIPAGPTNILISVKTQAARERLMVSGNRIESIGFGFFNSPEEFWTKSRMNLYKRMGFTALYMPNTTRDAIMARLDQNGLRQYAVNVNGTELYRPLDDFGEDMLRVAGKISLDL